MKTSIRGVIILIIMGFVLSLKADPFTQVVVTDAVQLEAARGIIGRVTPAVTNYFVLEIIPQDGSNDVYEIESVAGKIVLRGNDGVSLASAYHRYLKEYCKAQVSWNGNQLDLPDPLPVVPSKVRTTTLHEYRVYFNYCTLSYTGSWWDWDRWQREIDFMAMNGINMPLAPIGLEAVWYHTLVQEGFTDLEAREYLVGPSFFAWQWMTNIQSSGGPLPKEWIDQSVILGRKILEAERALGMTPIQQGFTGSVPVKLKEKQPAANIVIQSGWCGFEGTAQLDPLDPLFNTFGTTFLQTEVELFGTSHIYAADPFHEGRPPQSGTNYLTQVGNAIEDLIVGFDSEAIIAMQSWSIRETICKAFEKDHIIVLDLSGGRNDFWGYKYVKGQLHNFGGRINMHGDLAHIASNPFAKAAHDHPLCCGMGLFPEGIEQNPVFYNMVFDMVWRDSSVNVTTWLNDYALRRYGKQSDAAEQAWSILRTKGPYRRGTGGVEKSSIIAARPALIPKRSAQGGDFSYPYEALDLVNVWALLLSDYDALKDSEGYQFDLIDIGRQVLTNLGQEFNKDGSIAFRCQDQPGFTQATNRFLNLLTDVDCLLNTVPTHSFEKWVSDARGHSTDPATQDYYEWNASMLITLWGPTEQDDLVLFDYAWREWSGLIRLYYHPRWVRLYDHLGSLLDQCETYTDPMEQMRGREAFRANEFYEGLADWELAWTQTPHTFNAVPVVTAPELFEKYMPLITEMYSSEREARVAAILLKLSETENGVFVDNWEPEDMSTQWTNLTYDVTSVLKSNGSYFLSFLYESGNHRLDMSSVTFFQNGVEIDSDIHAGTTGHANTDNIYAFQLSTYNTNALYEVVAKVKSGGGTISYGAISLRRENASPVAQDASYTLAEDKAIGFSLGTISTSDPENDVLAYSITEGNSEGLFAIDSVTGEITVAGAIDYETTTSYDLVVSVIDTGFSRDKAAVSITITDVVNDDSDADGLTDEWEVLHFGSTSAQTGRNDADSDGASNAQEETFNTDPNNASNKPDAQYLGLRAWWKLDDASGGIATDSSGCRAAGTLNGPLWTTAGHNNGALEFDGVDDIIECGTLASLGGQTDLSLTAWIKTTNTASGVILQQRGGGQFNGEYQLLLNANGTVYFMLYGNRTYQYQITTTQTVNDGAWHFIVATREGQNGAIYIDGNPTPAASETGQLCDLDATIEVFIGQDDLNHNRVFKGLIDDVRIYNRTLTLLEIANLYDATMQRVYLSDINWTSATTGWGGTVKKDLSIQSNAITLNGVIYPKGLGAHAQSEIVYNLAGNYTAFHSLVGVDDETGSNGSLIFKVYGDDVLLYQTGVLSATNVETIDLDVTGVQTLKLTADENGSDAHDHADWADAFVSTSPASSPIAQWKNNQFTPEELLDPAVSGDGADLDADNLSTLIEYALGLDPKTHSGSMAGCAIELNGSNDWTVEFMHHTSHVDIDLVMEWTDEINPANWQPVAQSISGGTVQAMNGASVVSETGSEPTTVQLNVPSNVSHGFIRWVVTRH